LLLLTSETLKAALMAAAALLSSARLRVPEALRDRHDAAVDVNALRSHGAASIYELRRPCYVPFLIVCPTISNEFQ
jgi:hypothetical protein